MYIFTAPPQISYDSSKSSVSSLYMGRHFHVHSDVPRRQFLFCWYATVPLAQSLSKEGKWVLGTCFSFWENFQFGSFLQAKKLHFPIPVITETHGVVLKVARYTAFCMQLTVTINLGFLRLGWSISLKEVSWKTMYIWFLQSMIKSISFRFSADLPLSPVVYTEMSFLIQTFKIVVTS